MEDQQTIQQFVDAHGITATAQPADSNPNSADWMSGAHHWKVTLRLKAMQTEC